MHAVELGVGRRASYEVIGSGDPTLMFAGGPGFSSAYMRSTAELFADVLQSYLIDPHGSGGSTPPGDPNDYSPEGHARFYEEVRGALQLPRVTVFGHSFGATTALTYAALHPGAVDRCVAVAGLGIGTEADEAEGGAAEAEMEALLARHRDALWFEEAKKTWDNWTEWALAATDPFEIERMMRTVLPFYTVHPDRPDVAKALAEFGQNMKADLAAIKAWENGLYQGVDLRPLLGRIEVPTLVVAGELDLICGPAQARPIADGVTDSTLVMIPDCAHFPVVEAPDEFRARVTEWLTSTATGAS